MSGRIVVVGLGPAGAELLTDESRRALTSADAVFLRTRRHPAADAFPDAEACDDVYESAGQITEVYPAIVARLVTAAERGATIAYAVPGSPTVAERTVELLREQSRVGVEVLPAVSFADLAWGRLGIDPVASGVRMVDGHRFEIEAAGDVGPLLVAQCDNSTVLSDIKLSVDDGPAVTVLQRLGGEDETAFEVAWADLDRLVVPDHLTSLYIPELAAPVAAELVRLVELMHTLRRECPWDRDQTHASLAPFAVEETYEVLEAIEELADDPDEGYIHLEEELGDLLLQVVFHAELGVEAGRFTLGDVARGIHDKLYGRHPHVFGDASTDLDAVNRNWDRIKAEEKGRVGVMEGIPMTYPAPLLADKVIRRAAKAGDDVAPELATARATYDAAAAALRDAAMAIIGRYGTSR